MNPQFRFKNQVLLIALAAAYPAVGYAASAARIEFVSGSVVAISPAGIQRELMRGAVLESGEAIRTGSNARAQLRFSDGAMMSLQPQTEFRIDNYTYNGKVDGQEKGFFSLIKGGLRTITGLVGKGNRDNYKMSTSVATIGIRGTEYSTVFTGGNEGVLNLSTGEGAVEVCNSGGCVIIVSGESAVVTGVTPPTKTFVPPTPASTPITESKAAFSAVETTSEGGKPLIFGTDLVTGSGYTIAWLSHEGSNNYPTLGSASSTTAVFDPGSKLMKFEGGGNTYGAEVVVGAFSLDGVIGWGYWSSGKSSYSSGTPLADLHYVVGKPTGAADLSNLSGMVGTYALAGYTTPTSSNGYTGSGVSGSLTANFSANSLNVQLGMSMNGQNVSVAGSGSLSGANFYVSGTGTGGYSGNFYANGFFAGSNASHAGLAYEIQDGGSLGKISGAAVFKQTGLSVSPPM